MAPELPAEERGAAEGGNSQTANDPSQPGGKKAAAVDFARGLAHQRSGDFLRILRIAAEQSAVTGNIDDPRNAQRQAVQFQQCAGREYFLACACNAQPVTHVPLGLLA